MMKKQFEVIKKINFIIYALLIFTIILFGVYVLFHSQEPKKEFSIGNTTMCSSPYFVVNWTEAIVLCSNNPDYYFCEELFKMINKTENIECITLPSCEISGISQGEMVNFTIPIKNNICTIPFSRIYPKGSKYSPDEFEKLKVEIINITNCEQK